ncbi:redox-sensing transcriptional repressor Rex [Longimicrobium sp.]|uniref:redox-sensing transcriptional repressor Rex n=1 Tax=Longimicrobium sp. TaxID=2029185 RepID=UPI002B5FAEE6|nr:redox-sensing transcriptional repressor Rex [Longimicrobium sp.]HSU13947.1 redox-sensing transcriptional repressor Rex [Longimicrobium sp.]
MRAAVFARRPARRSAIRGMKKISESAVRRLSLYLRFLQEAEAAGADTISSGELARRGGTTSAQVRKDLSLFGSFGKRGMGYSVPELLLEIRQILGLTRPWNVAVIGAGRLGSALSSFRDFEGRGFHISAVFDNDPAKIGQSWGGLTVQPDEALDATLRERRVEIAIVAVPAEAAQGVVDRVVAAGVKAVLNFAPVRLRVPRGVTLRSVDPTLELEGLSFALSNGKDG